MTILIGVILVMAVLTYILPGGEFGTHIDPTTGAEVTGLEDFHYAKSTPVSIFSIPLRIVQAFVSGSTASIVVTYLFMGGCIYVITDSGAFQALIGVVMKRLLGKRFVMLAGFTCVFSLCNLVLSPHSFVAFVPFSVLFAYAIGYDTIVGVAMPLLGGAVAFSTGALLSTTMTAQTIVGLPLYSGAVYRLICQVVFLIPTILYIYNYGEAVRLGKRESISGFAYGEGAKKNFYKPVEIKHVIIMALFITTFAFVIIGSSKWGWSNQHLCALFMTLGIAVGLISGRPLDKTIDLYLKGSQYMLPSAVLAGLAGTAAGMLTSSGVMGTVVYHASNLILKVPPILYAPAMFTMQLIINCVIVSGGGQAASTMPVMAPIAKFCGIPLQSSVLCFNFGDGLGNYVLPYSNQLVSYLEAGKVGYGQWMKFMGKLFGIWVVIGWVMSAISVFVWA